MCLSPHSCFLFPWETPKGDSTKRLVELAIRQPTGVQHCDVLGGINTLAAAKYI